MKMGKIYVVCDLLLTYVDRHIPATILGRIYANVANIGFEKSFKYQSNVERSTIFLLTNYNKTHKILINETLFILFNLYVYRCYYCVLLNIFRCYLQQVFQIKL